MSSTFRSVLFQEMGLSLGAYLINETKGKSLERIQKAEKVCDEVLRRGEGGYSIVRVAQQKASKLKKEINIRQGHFSRLTYGHFF